MYFSVSEAELDTQCTCDKYVFQIRIVHVGQSGVTGHGAVSHSCG